MLAILWLFLLLFKVVFHDLKEKKAKREVLTPVITDNQASGDHSIEEGELVAVITAAIAMAESDYSGSNFRVVSFRRT